MKEFGREPDIWDGNDRAESDLRREKDYTRRRLRVVEKPEEAPDLILGLGELPAQELSLLVPLGHHRQQVGQVLVHARRDGDQLVSSRS